MQLLPFLAWLLYSLLYSWCSHVIGNCRKLAWHERLILDNLEQSLSWLQIYIRCSNMRADILNNKVWIYTGIYVSARKQANLKCAYPAIFVWLLY
jgi:hypothetical protein